MIPELFITWKACGVLEKPQNKMKVRLLSIGHKTPVWVTDAFNLYNKRLPVSQQIQLCETSAIKRHKKNNDSNIIKSAEAEQLMKLVMPNALVVALDEKGTLLTTQELSLSISKWQLSGRDVYILIGGADGLHESILGKADYVWSLSRLTFPHQLVRILVAEQFYRAHSLLNNHPYHRE